MNKLREQVTEILGKKTTTKKKADELITLILDDVSSIVKQCKLIDATYDEISDHIDNLRGSDEQ